MLAEFKCIWHAILLVTPFRRAEKKQKDGWCVGWHGRKVSPESFVA